MGEADAVGVAEPSVWERVLRVVVAVVVGGVGVCWGPRVREAVREGAEWVAEERVAEGEALDDTETVDGVGVGGVTERDGVTVLALHETDAGVRVCDEPERVGVRERGVDVAVGEAGWESVRERVNVVVGRGVVVKERDRDRDRVGEAGWSCDAVRDPVVEGVNDGVAVMGKEAVQVAVSDAVRDGVESVGEGE